MWCARGVGGLLVLVLSLGTAHAAENLALYDDFAKKIEPTHWYGQEGTLLGPGLGEEAGRQVRGGQLLMNYIGYGDTTVDDGAVSGLFALRFKDSASVTATRVTVDVDKLVVQGCAGNFYPTYGQVRIGGNFFNTGTPVPGSQVNDVVAQIVVQRASDSPDPTGVMRIFSIVTLCLADDCTTFNQLLAYADLGTVSVGQNTTLMLQWDPDNDQFLVQKDSDPTLNLSYFVTDAEPPGRDAKGLEIAPVVSNCTTTPRPSSGLAVILDDVYVNESAVRN